MHKNKVNKYPSPFAPKRNETPCTFVRYCARAALGAMLLVSSLASADEAYFNENVAPQLAQHTCAICHTGQSIRPRVFEYRELLPYLAMGTSRESNVLIAKMTNARPALADVASHPGGQKCKTKEDQPCLAFMQWWDEEFKK